MEAKPPANRPAAAARQSIQFNEEDIRRTLRRAFILAGAVVLVVTRFCGPGWAGGHG